MCWLWAFCNNCVSPDSYCNQTFEIGECRAIRRNESNKIKLKRVYEDVEENDGARFLVERLWPRGMKKDNLVMDAWLKDVAPSDSLRRWYAHDVQKWEEFQQRYRSELEKNAKGWEPILDALEARYPMLLGTIRDQVTGERRPFLRFFACEEDLSHEAPDAPLPEAVAAGTEPFLIVGAIAGG